MHTSCQAKKMITFEVHNKERASTINIMIKHLFLFLSVVFAFLLLSCDAPREESQTEKFERDLQTFNQKMDNVSQTMNILEALQKELDVLEQQRAEGKISDEEFNVRANEVKDTYGRALAKRDKVTPANGLPQWALQLGLTEPQGLTLDAAFSQVTSVQNKNEGFNSVTLVYTGNYEHAMGEATRIARQAGIPLGKDFVQARELAKTYSSTPVKGIAFMNFDPYVKDAPVNISITVDEMGMLTLSAVDVEQMKRQFDRPHNNDNP